MASRRGGRLITSRRVSFWFSSLLRRTPTAEKLEISCLPQSLLLKRLCFSKHRWRVATEVIPLLAQGFKSWSWARRSHWLVGYQVCLQVVTCISWRFWSLSPHLWQPLCLTMERTIACHLFEKFFTFLWRKNKSLPGWFHFGRKLTDICANLMKTFAVYVLTNVFPWPQINLWDFPRPWDFLVLLQAR